MRASNLVRDFIKSKEKYSAKVYRDPKTGGRPYTGGWGTTRPEFRLGMEKSMDEWQRYFDTDIEHFETLANNAITVPVTQGQFDAFVSILYNVGPGSPDRDGIIRLKDGRPSTLLRKLNEGDYVNARSEFLRWVSPGSNVENGLRTRRREELAYFYDIS